MQNRLRDFRNFETYKDKFNEKLKQIKLKYQKIQNSREESLRIEDKIKSSEAIFDQLSAEKNMYIDNIDDARYQLAFQTQTYKKNRI